MELAIIMLVSSFLVEFMNLLAQLGFSEEVIVLDVFVFFESNSGYISSDNFEHYEYNKQ